MAGTVSQIEATPAEYPTSSDDALWQRIEAYCAHRWTPREVIWIADGPGHWQPPLHPAQIDAVEAWTGSGYEAVTLAASPLGGLHLPLSGPYRFTATVGADNAAPDAVIESFDRLKAYLEADPGAVAGASSYSINLGQISENFRRSPQWLARAMDWSGAADLLRPYRRA